jgi:hypothetical protein
MHAPGNGDRRWPQPQPDFWNPTADEPFRDRVRSRCPHWGADDADVRAGEDRVEGGSEHAVPVADQKPESGRVITQVHE